MARCAHRSVKGLCDVYPAFPTLIYGNASAIDDRVCSRGYTGRICSNCRENYYKYGGGTCIECPSPVVVLLIAAVVVIIFVVIAEASASPVLTIFISTVELAKSCITESVWDSSPTDSGRNLEYLSRV